MVSFTGSTGVGVRDRRGRWSHDEADVARARREGAALVFDDADVRTAVSMIGSAWTFHSGQICTAHPGDHPAPTVRAGRRGLAKMANVLKVGDPYEPGTVVGPVITAAHRIVEGYVQIGRDRRRRGRRGANGRRSPTPASTSRPPSSPAAARHARPGGKRFGPVIVAIPFDDEDDGVAIANDTDFGLYDYVFSADTNRAFRVSKRLRSGNVGINTTQRNHNAPFGGMKFSGVGRDGGVFGLPRTARCSPSSGRDNQVGFSDSLRVDRP